jgi:hypothetical protein
MKKKLKSKFYLIIFLSPCFDEPFFKATFNITLDHEANLVALSNMQNIVRKSKFELIWKNFNFYLNHKKRLILPYLKMMN